MSVNNPWLVSVALHGFLVLLAGLGVLVSRRVAIRSTTVEFKVIERPVVAKPTPLAIARPAKSEIKPGRAVFGASRKSALSTDPAAVAVKPGNTLAKPQDNETLSADDPDALPNPVDEFLVSEMPSLAREIRIPYPPEAKKKGVQGPVIMDLLIDSAGNVRDVKLVSGPGSGLDEAALRAVVDFRFKPALIEGKPVTVRIRYAYRFVLEH